MQGFRADVRAGGAGDRVENLGRAAQCHKSRRPGPSVRLFNPTYRVALLAFAINTKLIYTIPQRPLLTSLNMLSVVLTFLRWFWRWEWNMTDWRYHKFDPKLYRIE
jgi:hypothetical protein